VRLATLLRLTALGIAIMCWLDPQSTIAPQPPIVVDAAIVRSARDARPARDGSSLTVLDLARQTAAGLGRRLGAAGTVRVHEVAEGLALPCDATQPCLVLTGGAPVVIPPDRKGPLYFASVGEPLTNNVEARELAAAPAHLDGQAVARVTLSGRGLQGRNTRIRMRDGSAIVGEAVHTWSADGDVAVDVPWWPVSGGTRQLVAEARTDESDVTPLDDDVAATVDVSAGRWPVVAIERRPSWGSTFIRRALEDDRRFELLARTDVAPGISVASNPNLLEARQLDRARVVIAGAPDALTSEDVARLDGFVRRRGGAVVLVADRPLHGPVTKLLVHSWRERIDPSAVAAGPLRGTEWLIAAGVTPLDHVWAEAPHGPSVVSAPLGAGVVLVSGALDAWRHRAEDGAFERFWQATIAALAGGVSEPVDVRVTRETPEDGGEVEVSVRARSVSEVKSWRVAATRTCDLGEPVAIRLWPGDAAGAFYGRVPLGTRTGCQIAASVDGLGQGTAAIGGSAARGSSQRWTRAEVASIAARTGGAVVTDGDIEPVVRAWLGARGPERRPETRHPMRSWWWLIPFAGCLAGEWWLRRRAGLR